MAFGTREERLEREAERLSEENGRLREENDKLRETVQNQGASIKGLREAVDIQARQRHRVEANLRTLKTVSAQGPEKPEEDVKEQVKNAMHRAEYAMENTPGNASRVILCDLLDALREIVR